MVFRILKFIFFVTLIVVGAAALALILAIEDEPTVLDFAAPTPGDVTEARAFVQGVRRSLRASAEAPARFETTESQLNSVTKLVARFVPGFRGEMSIASSQVVGNASIPVPFTDEARWLNLRATAPEFDGAFQLSSVGVGPFELPPTLTLEMGRVGANLVFGDRFGDTVLAAASRMEIKDSKLEFELVMDEVGSNGMMRRLFGQMRGSDLPGPEEIDRYYRLIRTAMDAGYLPSEGSFLPYVQFTLDAALDGSETEGIENAYTSAIVALTRVCGARGFAMVVGDQVAGRGADDTDWASDCGQLTLNGRIDSRRHFTTAAALQAASNRGFSVSVGEFKELYDTVRAGGFDFTDIAANNSGIRMSNTLMAAPASDWPELISRIQSESDVIVMFDGIPQIMSEAEFKARFGEVDSPQYVRMLAEIESKIDGLPLHQ